AHAQCPETACHLGPDDPLEGQCFLPEEVIWIDNAAPCPGLGTQEEPACSLQSVAATLGPGDVTVLRIAGGMPYAERAVFAGEMTVAIIGVGDPVISGHPMQQAATFNFSGGAIAYVQGVNLVGNPLTHGIMCSLSTLRVQDSEIRNNGGWGLFDFDPCTLDLERTVIAGNDDGGLRVSQGELRLVNATVGLNGQGGNSTGIRLLNADAAILYSTIAGNDGSGSDSIECVGASGTLRNNIITGLQAPSIELDCFPLLMDHNAMDAANFASGTNVAVGAYNEIYFDNPAAGDFTLSAPPLTPFGDVALWLEGDPERDADGTLRPTDGSPGYAGVDEP
ncbi:MAG: right-handed parallel beta-helix repeat-containing protein, partial [Myxococcales bacterium]|nr:right-handed parallel beta-helix repeat-containing protein [Myxococcales bacterium]